MPQEEKRKTLGQAIDELIGALKDLEPSTRAVAIRAACEQLGVETPALLAAPPSGLPPAFTPGTPPMRQDGLPPTRVLDIRALRAEKQPGSAVEMAAVVAHYLQALAPAGERKDEITTPDLDKYFRQADFPLQKRLVNVLPNGKAAGYFDSSTRGAYKLNPVGYNLVVHSLPRKSGGGAARRPRMAAPKKAGRRKK